MWASTICPTTVAKGASSRTLTKSVVMNRSTDCSATGAILSEAMRRRAVLARGGEVNGPFLSSVVKSKIPYGVAIAIGGGVVAVGLWTG